ncbi:Uncharacterised protein [Mycobacterium tuberculosis]|uniref:Uncharacterized protein n=1 Tax=Mycobacterium tuberculosis TaxID=1773 RepID=A0A654TE45_MYCTX|nr:Uncharacterised protein [Mycobacterium tuberculosis]CNL97536.1 Uncharacterised protein [Mycobacterium tuberculosis]CNN03947.1 Uncharacterised protein [Mycobacterium tuberculosis]CNU36449.1 Uncharacterised protein [Mycobacterium tuberculosis]CNU74566.1 Uncharacterised protein [Mycobacterium tuberculosis]
MQVMHYRMANLTVLAVNVADLAFDVVAQRLVALHPLAARGSQLDQDGVVAFDAALGQQLGKGLQPYVDALGVVEPVNTEQDLARISQFGANLAGPAPDVAVAGSVVERAGVNRDRKGANSYGAGPEHRRTEPRPHTDGSAGSVGADQTPGQDQEILGTARKMEAHQVGAQ